MYPANAGRGNNIYLPELFTEFLISIFAIEIVFFLMSCIDTYKHKGMRRQLALEIQQKGISDKNILAAIERVPRHCFVDRLTAQSMGETAFVSLIYQDQAFPIGAGQTISQPFTVAFQSSLLELQKGEKILEIGTGSGYQTSVLMELGAKVFSIERQRSLYDMVKKFLPEIGYNPKLFYGDGYAGLPTFAPFDKILVTAGAPFVPEPLKQQLKTGGILVIPVGEGGSQTMIRIKKISENEYITEEHGKFRFVPLLENKSGGGNKSL